MNLRTVKLLLVAMLVIAIFPFFQNFSSYENLPPYVFVQKMEPGRFDDVLYSQAYPNMDSLFYDYNLLRSRGITIYNYTKYRNSLALAMTPIAEVQRYGLNHVYNIYQIDRSNIEKAIQVGFSLVTGTNLNYTKPCSEFSDNTKNAAVLVIGQSLAANSTLKNPKQVRNPNVRSFYRERCYDSEEPQLNTGGGGLTPDGLSGGSFLTDFGNLILKNSSYQKVLLVPIAVPGSKIQQWDVGGEFHNRILSIIDQLQRANVKLTHIIWQQGESDSDPDLAKGISKAEYKQRLANIVKVIRSKGVAAPFYAALSTAMDWRSYDIALNISNTQRAPGLQPNARVREAIQELQNEIQGFFVGPDIDQLSEFYRTDYAHLNPEGSDQQAKMWVDTLFKTSLADKYLKKSIYGLQGYDDNMNSPIFNEATPYFTSNGSLFFIEKRPNLPKHVALYRCFDQSKGDHFEIINNCPSGVINEGIFGFVLPATEAKPTNYEELYECSSQSNIKFDRLITNNRFLCESKNYTVKLFAFTIKRTIFRDYIYR